RAAIAADAEDGGEHVGLAERLGQVRAMAKFAIDLEVDQPVERDRRARSALDEDAMVADVEGRDGRELGIAARILPYDLTAHREGLPLRRPFVAAGVVALNEAKTLLHRR